MVIGTYIESQTHYARAKRNHGKTILMIGCEPAGHYWFVLTTYVQKHQMNLIILVKKIKELDGNSPKKTDS